MSKNEFLKKLDKALTDLPERERKEIRYDYEEHFQNARAAGKTEVETINSLGDPESIAQQYLAGNPEKITGADRSILSIVRSVFTKAGSGLVGFSERITGNGLTFGLVTALLLGILAFEIFTLIQQNQVLEIQKDYQYQGLVAVIKVYQDQAKFNPDAFAVLLKIAEKAKYNLEAIETAAYILANAGYNTPPVLAIAQIAGSADHEVKHLNDLLEVTITFGYDNERMVELAKKAVNNEVSEAELETAIKYYREHSRAKTIEEAAENMEQAYENP